MGGCVIAAHKALQSQAPKCKQVWRCGVGMARLWRGCGLHRHLVCIICPSGLRPSLSGACAGVSVCQARDTAAYILGVLLTHRWRPALSAAAADPALAAVSGFWPAHAPRPADLSAAQAATKARLVALGTYTTQAAFQRSVRCRTQSWRLRAADHSGQSHSPALGGSGPRLGCCPRLARPPLCP